MLNTRSIRSALSTSALLVAMVTTPVFAQQPGDALSEEFPELSAFFNAFILTQGAMYSKIAAIGESPSSEDARNKLSVSLKMQADMKMGHSMNMSQGSNMAGMTMGPFGMLESAAMSELIAMIGSRYDPEDAGTAWSRVDAVTADVAAVLQHGHTFETRLFDIYADQGVVDKQEAVATAISNYLQSDQLAVPQRPKSTDLLESHPYTSAFKTGYPELNGLNWTTQWLQFAALEALLQRANVDYSNAGVSTAIERFSSKVTGMQGIMSSPIPVEMPMAPVISPLLYHLHPQVAVILDNLNMFEIVIADILVHPGVEDRSAAMDQAVKDFTNSETNLVAEQDYLLWAMRGGLFNQGGPAWGEELNRSMRNRSRSEMGMRHAMTMSVPQ